VLPRAKISDPHRLFPSHHCLAGWRSFVCLAPRNVTPKSFSKLVPQSTFPSRGSGTEIRLCRTVRRPGHRQSWRASRSGPHSPHRRPKTVLAKSLYRFWRLPGEQLLSILRIQVSQFIGGNDWRRKTTADLQSPNSLGSLDSEASATASVAACPVRSGPRHCDQSPARIGP